MALTDYIPSIDWIKNYNRRMLQGDLSAGITVGVMLVPQGMAYSMLAGLPPIYGLYAATIPLLLYAMFGTSRQLAVGPVAMVALLVLAGVGQIATPGSEEFIRLALLLSIMVGVFQLLLGLLRMGFLVNFLSHPVVSGFTSAAALIIGFSQLKNLTGINIPSSNYVHEILFNFINRLAEANLFTLSLGIGSILLILTLKRINKFIPGPLIVVVLGILMVYGFSWQKMNVAVVGEVPAGLPSFGMSSFGWGDVRALIPVMLTISLVGFMESIAVAKALHARHKNYKLIPNQELIALGIANIGGGLFQSFPVVGGFSRSAVNDQAGAKSGMASIISAVLIIITLLFFTSLFYFLPKSVLAAIIMVAVFGLIDWKEAVHLWHVDKRDFAMLAATFVATLALGIEEGILFGVILSLVMVVFRAAYPHMAKLGEVGESGIYRNLDRFPQAKVPEGALIVRLDAQLFFANSNFFKEKIESWIADCKYEVHALIVDASAINQIDSTALHALHDLRDDLTKQKIKIYFSGVKGPVRDKFQRSGLFDFIGRDHFFADLKQAVGCFLKEESANGENLVFQSNA
jgi:sulfate permease, SulP family